MWYYNNQIFTSDQIDDNIGFIYIITEIDTQKMYIGKKIFFNKVIKKPLKGKTRRRISKKESDWQTYYGSSDSLKEAIAQKGESNYRREIIRLCESKSSMNYWETYEIIARHTLLQPDKYYNSWVSAKVNRNQIAEMINEFQSIPT
jgi:hypothetical protein